MPLNTQQQNAISYAAALSGVALAMQQLLIQIQQVQLQQSDHNYLGTLGNLPTAATNPDGSVGTADNSPVGDHVIVGLNVTYNEFNAMVGTMGDVANVLTGVAMSNTFDRRPIFGALLP